MCTLQKKTKMFTFLLILLFSSFRLKSVITDITDVVVEASQSLIQTNTVLYVINIRVIDREVLSAEAQGIMVRRGGRGQHRGTGGHWVMFFLRSSYELKGCLSPIVSVPALCYITIYHCSHVDPRYSWGRWGRADPHKTMWSVSSCSSIFAGTD